MSEHLEQLKSALGDRYVIEEELGIGGMATVYRAHDVRHDRKVAIKVLRPDLAASIGSERFLREIRIAAKLTHPHILPLHDSGKVEDLLYYVMPYVEGESLRDRLEREGALPVPDAVRLLREVADALAHAHKQGIVHRDIKPDNVMLAEGHGLVTDFGVAKAVTDAQASQKTTALGIAVGTPAYMAPEQAAADPNVDHRADIYALGAMAYEMLAGRPPFEADTMQTVLAAHVTEPPEPIARHRPTIPESLAEIVMRCLAKRPADRWQSAAEIRDLLEASATPVGLTPAGVTAAAGASPGDAETRLRRSHPARVLGLFAVGALAVLGTVYFVVIELGLPNWVLGAAFALVAACFPVAIFTGRAERRRARHPAGEGQETGVSQWLTWRRAVTGAGAAFATLGLAAAVYMAMRLMGIGPVGTLVASGVLAEREPIVLAEFENRTADSALGGTVTELLRIDLAQSRAVTVLEPVQVGRVLTRMERDPTMPLTPTLAREVAEREGLKAIVTGEILQVGNGLVVSSRLTQASTGEALWAGRESTSDPARLIEAVDRLSASLRERIGESLKTIRADAPLAQVTTGSTEALRKYAQADRANNQGEYQRAIRLLEEALEVDSTFAMAHRKLGVILRNQNQDPEWASQEFTKAYELRERLTDRERYLAEAAYFSYVTEDEPAAVDAYRSLLEKYPTDRIALNNLAIIYSSMGRREEAAELHVRSIALGGAPAVTFSNAIPLLYELGRTDSARAVLEQFAAEYPGHPAVLMQRASFASAQFDFDTAERYTEELLASQRGNPVFETSAKLYLASHALIHGRVREAHGLLKEGYDTQASAGLRFIRLPWEVLEAEGEAALSLRYYDNRARAVVALDGVTRSSVWRSLEPKDREYLSLASLYAEAGRPDRAEELMAEWNRLDQATRDQQQGPYHEVLGAIAVAKGRPLQGVKEYRAAQRQAKECSLCGLAELARAYEAAGQLDSAAVIYERYLTTPALFRVSKDNLELVPVIRRLAAVYERMGNGQKAVEYYDRFIQLWKGADPELQPLVEDARARIAALIGES